MKKIIALVLLLCLALSCMPAMAGAALERTETRVIRDIDNKMISVYLQLTNTGDVPVGLDKATISLYDANDTLLLEESTYGMYPGYLLPGEVGYVIKVFYSVDPEVAKAISTYTVNLEAESEWLYEIKRLPATVSYVKEEGSYSTYHYAEMAITNDTADMLWEPEYVFVVRSTAGKILSVVHSNAFDTGTIAGGTIYCRSNLGTKSVDTWTAAGHEIGEIEVYAYYELDE